MDHTLRIYDIETMTCQQAFGKSDNEHMGHSNRIYSIRWDPNNDNLVYSGGWDNIVSLYDTRARHAVNHISGPYISGDTIDVRGDMVLTGSYRVEDCLEIWDVRKEERLHSIPWATEHDATDSGYIMACAFDEFGHSVIAASS